MEICFFFAVVKIERLARVCVCVSRSSGKTRNGANRGCGAATSFRFHIASVWMPFGLWEIGNCFIMYISTAERRIASMVSVTNIFPPYSVMCAKARQLLTIVANSESPHRMPNEWNARKMIYVSQRNRLNKYLAKVCVESMFFFIWPRTSRSSAPNVSSTDV